MLPWPLRIEKPSRNTSQCSTTKVEASLRMHKFRNSECIQTKFSCLHRKYLGLSKQPLQRHFKIIRLWFVIRTLHELTSGLPQLRQLFMTFHWWNSNRLNGDILRGERFAVNNNRFPVETGAAQNDSTLIPFRAGILSSREFHDVRSRISYLASTDSVASLRTDTPW